MPRGAPFWVPVREAEPAGRGGGEREGGGRQGAGWPPIGPRAGFVEGMSGAGRGLRGARWAWIKRGRGAPRGAGGEVTFLIFA